MTGSHLTYQQVFHRETSPALVGDDWVTVPVYSDGTLVSTNEDPHGNNTEGNGITGTSGGADFVDEPQYVDYTATLPAGAADLRFRHSTDAAYLDTGWCIDTVSVAGAPAELSGDDWIETTAAQDNNWTVQVISNCDLTPGGTSSTGTEIVDPAGNFVYRYEGDGFSTDTFTTRCANGGQADLVVSVSATCRRDLAVLEAECGYMVMKHQK